MLRKVYCGIINHNNDTVSSYCLPLSMNIVLSGGRIHPEWLSVRRSLALCIIHAKEKTLQHFRKKANIRPFVDKGAQPRARN